MKHTNVKRSHGRYPWGSPDYLEMNKQLREEAAGLKREAKELAKEHRRATREEG